MRPRRTRRADQVSIATFNVENLAPGDPQTKFDGLADLIVNNLQAPGHRGARGDPGQQRRHRRRHRRRPTQTFAKLIDAIAARRRPDLPVPRRSTRSTTRTAASPAATSASASCSAPTAGCRSSTGRAARSTTAVTVQPRPAAVVQPGPDRPDQRGLEREPQAAGGGVHFRGKHLFVIANHFNSKGGDDPLMGRFQPPVPVDEPPAPPAGDAGARLRRPDPEPGRERRRRRARRPERLRVQPDPAHPHRQRPTSWTT